MPRTFIDTNIWIYSIDPRDEAKRKVAQQRIADLIRDGQAVVSMQVISEFARAALEKLRVPPDQIKGMLDLFQFVDVAAIETTSILRAIELYQLYSVAYWDALILAAAERSACSILLSEDLRAGQSYSGVKVENPF